MREYLDQKCPICGGKDIYTVNVSGIGILGRCESMSRDVTMQIEISQVLSWRYDIDSNVITMTIKPKTDGE